MKDVSAAFVALEELRGGPPAGTLTAIVEALAISSTKYAPVNYDYPDDEVISAEDQAALDGLPLLSQSIVERREKTKDGTLIKVVGPIWGRIVDILRTDWNAAYQLPPERFEELVAGAFEREGYHDVILTPRSGDCGRDVIAVRRGVGSIKIITSVKRYAANRKVPHDDIRALVGVLNCEQDASKGMLVTTSRFPARIEQERFLAPLFPHRLELMDGPQLLKWLCRLRRN
ncbi:restriction endonuclease [Sphingomonas sanxanigenens]|uniref:Restriction endonuclease type IV Mrr domain-containing protein n=1 Tax=Sphingomonas sanxanigenens DSM 19645 = NX02 TaxID=1123269 RepID=W0AEU6_9SPHN|nr:restriction endonuclease [Sphingomonas sanxanigenens]AHE55037.1 hypothetical protein NX02_16795 [Sphingomonas sanxanigenens DSM 19645 = NX02]